MPADRYVELAKILLLCAHGSKWYPHKAIINTECKLSLLTREREHLLTRHTGMRSGWVGWSTVEREQLLPRHTCMMSGWIGWKRGCERGGSTVEREQLLPRHTGMMNGWIGWKRREEGREEASITETYL
jgi:hypothetical protein